ncbi:unnamed protein product [Ascophyllum nodosum]
MQQYLSIGALLILLSVLGSECLHSPFPSRVSARSPSSRGWVWLIKGLAQSESWRDEQDQDGSGVPDKLRDVVIEKIEEIGGGKVKEQVKETTAGPGLNTRHFKYIATGGTFMAKIARDSDVDTFLAERAGLEAILETRCLRAPTPLAQGTLPLGGSFLLMEHVPFIPFGQSIPEVLKHLAEGLARMHLRVPGPDAKGFGFARDNFLGASPQDNTWKSDFGTFMVENRLLPQLERAYRKFSDEYGTNNEDALALRSLGPEVLQRVKDVLAPVADAQPVLLHGDLWVGNYGAVPVESGLSREAVVFDPACWYGVQEFDLALAMMFGGFGQPFFDTYHAIIPKTEGFDGRMRIYKLYHYLNHLNLYGAGFGDGGTVEEPRGYYERCTGLMREIIADGR